MKRLLPMLLALTVYAQCKHSTANEPYSLLRLDSLYCSSIIGPKPPRLHLPHHENVIIINTFS